jgi:hypothetical protein
MKTNNSLVVAAIVFTDTTAASHNRIEEVTSVHASMMLLLRSDTRVL